MECLTSQIPSNLDNDLSAVLARVEVVKSSRGFLKLKDPINEGLQRHLVVGEKLAELLMLNLRADSNTPVKQK